jgi:hypothetical protein
LIAFLFVGLISASISIYFWLINLFSGVDPLAENIKQITKKAEDKTSKILDTGILGAQLSIILMVLLIIKQLNNLGFGNLPIIRIIVQIIWNFLEKFEKNIFDGIKDNNNKKPLENQKPANLLTSTGRDPGPTDSSTVVNIQNPVKILKPKLPRGIRLIRVVLKKTYKKLKN